MNKRIKTVGIIVIVVGLLGGVVAWRSTGRANKPADTEQAQETLSFTPAEITAPRMAPMPLVIQLSGPLTAPQTVTIRAKAAGTLQTLLVQEGTRVSKGQLLGQIDPEDLRNRVMEREATLTSAQARFAEAQRNFKASEDLARQGFISAQAMEGLRATQEGARAQLSAAEAQLGITRVAVKDAVLAAPISGIVGKRKVVAGEKVSPEQELFTIYDISKLELVALAGAEVVPELKVGMPVQIAVDGVSTPVKARVDRIAPAAETGSRGIAVAMAFDNPGERVRAGQFAIATVSVPDPVQRMVLPLSAVTQSSGQDQVWSLEKGVLVRRIITTGRRDVASNTVEVLTGLPQNAQVLGLRFDNLREGAPFKVVAARPGTPASGASAPLAASAPAAAASAMAPTAASASAAAPTAPAASATASAAGTR